MLDLSNYLESNLFSAVFLRIGYGMFILIYILLTLYKFVGLFNFLSTFVVAEFDNPFFGYSDDPDSYVDAFRYVVRYMRHSLSDVSLVKTKFVWHSWAAPRLNGIPLEAFYPGDEFVDWVGISVFQQLFPWSSNWINGSVNWGGDYSDVQEVLLFAKNHKKVRKFLIFQIFRPFYI